MKKIFRQKPCKIRMTIVLYNQFIIFKIRAFFPPKEISVKKIKFIVVKNPGCLSEASSWILDSKIDF
jgi:hypothetical protein